MGTVTSQESASATCQSYFPPRKWFIKHLLTFSPSRIQCWVSWCQFGRLYYNNLHIFTRYFCPCSWIFPPFNEPHFFYVMRTSYSMQNFYIYLKSLHLWPFCFLFLSWHSRVRNFVHLEKFFFGCYFFLCSLVSWHFHFNWKLEFCLREKCFFFLNLKILAHKILCILGVLNLLLLLPWLADTEEKWQMLVMRFCA